MIMPLVDHSWFYGVARHQGIRPTCLAFAASDLNAALHETEHLSVEYLCHHTSRSMHFWSPDEGFTLDAVLAAVEKPGQPLEQLYPYSGDNHDAPAMAPPDNLSLLYRAITRARDLSVDDIASRVVAGDGVGIIVAVTQSLYYPIEGMIKWDPYVIPELLHALIVTGLGTHQSTGERHFLVRNSWGKDWGNQGYAWMPDSHLNLHLIEGFVI